MHVLHVTPYYKPAYAFGGVVRSVEGMATALAARGHQVTVLTTDALDQKRRHSGAHDEIIDGLRVLRRPNLLPWLRGNLNLSTPRSMRRSAVSILPSVDVVHLHEFRTVENLLVSPLAQALGKPIALSPHGTLSRATGRGRLKLLWDRLFGADIALRIDQVIALTETGHGEVQSLWSTFGARHDQTRFSVIANGVHLSEFASLPSAKDFRARYHLGKAPTVLFMGRLQARKGVDVLINAFRAADVAESRLLIIGPDEGMLSTLRDLAEGDPRIAFTGYLADEARLQALAASDIFALPATGEGQSIAVLEAMAAGMPVVLSPGCNMDEVADYGAGFVLPASEEAFAVKLRELLLDSDLRREMGAKARRLVEEKYTWNMVAVELERVYQGLIDLA